jgi:hypothetical protein
VGYSSEEKNRETVIYQICKIETKTGPLIEINEGLIRVRKIQARLKNQLADELLPKTRWQHPTPTVSDEHPHR